MKSQLFKLFTFSAVGAFGVLAGVSLAFAGTTIGTDINTDGDLNVTGTTTIGAILTINGTNVTQPQLIIGAQGFDNNSQPYAGVPSTGSGFLYLAGSNADGGMIITAVANTSLNTAGFGILNLEAIPSNLADTGAPQVQPMIQLTPDTSYTLGNGALPTNQPMFGIQAGYGPIALGVWEGHGDTYGAGGLPDSVGLVGINMSDAADSPDDGTPANVPGAILHVRNRLTSAGALVNMPVALFEGLASQAADLIQAKLTGGGILFSVSNTGSVIATSVKTTPVTVSALPTCNSGTKGTFAYVTDSNTVTWGATVAGGSTSNAGVSCNGTNWTVFSK